MPDESSALTFPLQNPSRIVCPVGIGSPIEAPDGTLQTDVASQQFLALWDTGAEFTHVVPQVIQAAGLKSVGFRPSAGIDGVITNRKLYRASVVTVSGVTVPLGTTNVTAPVMKLHATTVVGLESDDQLRGIHVLIGMDIIGRGDFALSTDSKGVRWVSFLHPGMGRRLNLKSLDQKRSAARKRAAPKKRATRPRRRRGK